MNDIFLAVQRNYGSTEKYTVTECRGQYGRKVDFNTLDAELVAEMMLSDSEPKRWLAERHHNCPPLLKAFCKDGYSGMTLKEFWAATQS